MQTELLTLILAVLTFVNIAKISSESEYTVIADSQDHVIEFCKHAGCSFVHKVSILHILRLA